MSEKVQETGPPGGARRVAERPDPYIWELDSHPAGPEGGIIAGAAPGGERIAAEAVDEYHIRLARGIIAAGDLMQASQEFTFFEEY